MARVGSDCTNRGGSAERLELLEVLLLLGALRKAQETVECGEEIRKRLRCIEKRAAESFRHSELEKLSQVGDEVVLVDKRFHLRRSANAPRACESARRHRYAQSKLASSQKGREGGDKARLEDWPRVFG